ncbi:MAG: CFI-box-CTERM domain-containing protein [bacterium]
MLQLAGPPRVSNPEETKGVCMRFLLRTMTSAKGRVAIVTLTMLLAAGALRAECGKYYCDYYGSLGPSSFKMPCRCGRAQTLGDYTFLGTTRRSSDEAAGYIHTHLLRCSYCGHDVGNPIYASPSSPSYGGYNPGAQSCFIATAAYGTPDEPEVVLLRSFRDQRLLTSAAGRQFVAAYYACSPPIARLIEKSPLARAATRVLLRPVTGAVRYAVYGTARRHADGLEHE